MAIPFDNSFSRLPEGFFATLPPEPVRDPAIIRINDALAETLGIPALDLTAETLAGQSVPPGARPLAMAYAGHQFGNFVPQLGDGRALLLGEVLDTDGQRYDIQLKGSGRTPFSRAGDGRAWLGPVLREYIVSEAMHALGIPTTRALAAVTTGETVLREAALPGAVLTRVARGHIRVGTFQYFAVREQFDHLKTLADYAIDRLYPDLSGATYADFLERVCEAQANLVAQWMGVGFIHGVMNTDNMAISGETIDYGPCAFMDTFHPETVFSSIDRMGRYAYRNQPGIAQWNLAQLAGALLPIIDDDPDTALETVQSIIDSFPALFGDAYLRVFRTKLCLTTAEDGDSKLIESLLQEMTTHKLDYTNTFRSLLDAPQVLGEWLPSWEARLTRQPDQPLAETLAAANPAVIPRNHRIEAAITAAVAGDFGPFHHLTDLLMTPFELSDANAAYANPPEPGEEVLQTFCGT